MRRAENGDPPTMVIEYPGFGQISVDGETYDHDIVIERGSARKRDKGPSRHLKAHYGHTPLTAAEQLPLDVDRLVIGSGYSGRLPIVDEVEEAAVRHGTRLEVMPTAQACAMLNGLAREDVTAVLHVTC